MKRLNWKKKRPHLKRFNKFFKKSNSSLNKQAPSNFSRVQKPRREKSRFIDQNEKMQEKTKERQPPVFIEGNQFRILLSFIFCCNFPVEWKITQSKMQVSLKGTCKNCSKNFEWCSSSFFSNRRSILLSEIFTAAHLSGLCFSALQTFFKI